MNASNCWLTIHITNDVSKTIIVRVYLLKATFISNIITSLGYSVKYFGSLAYMPLCKQKSEKIQA